jgi:TPR repeat protein
MQTETQEFAGYSPLFEPPKTRSLPAYQPMLVPGDYYESVEIAFGLFLLQWLTAAFLTAAGLLYFKGSDKKSLQEWLSSVITPAKTGSSSNPPKATSPDPPISKTQVPTDVGSNKASETTPRNQLSPWKRADKAFGFGFFLGVATTYSVQSDISSSDRMLLAGIMGVVCGLVAYLVAVVYYAGKGKWEGAAQTGATKARNRAGLVLVGIIGLFAVLWLIGKNQETKTPQENPNSSAASQVEKPNNAADAEAQAAAQFEKDFYEKYPDLKPYGDVFVAVASRLQASGYRGESREASIEMFANAARQELGRRFEQGDGVTKDYVEAAKWYQKAAEQNYAPAQYNLGVMYQNGGGVTQDVMEAFKWFSLAAAQGNADAATNRDNLAGALTPDQETESSWRIALFQIRFKNAASPADIPTLKRSAEQGDGQAQIALGWLYCSGSAVPQNYAEAVNWWRKAADQGLASAQNSVGMMYNLGHGVPQSYGEAFKWFFKAAQQGEAVGQYNVGEAFEFGRGVPQDDVTAYTWYSLAAEQALSVAIIHRDTLSRRLTQEQVAEALRHFIAFKPAKQSSP